MAKRRRSPPFDWSPFPEHVWAFIIAINSHGRGKLKTNFYLNAFVVVLISKNIYWLSYLIIIEDVRVFRIGVWRSHFGKNPSLLECGRNVKRKVKQKNKFNYIRKYANGNMVRFILLLFTTNKMRVCWGKRLRQDGAVHWAEFNGVPALNICGGVEKWRGYKRRCENGTYLAFPSRQQKPICDKYYLTRLPVVCTHILKLCVYRTQDYPDKPQILRDDNTRLDSLNTCHILLLLFPQGSLFRLWWY